MILLWFSAPIVPAARMRSIGILGTKHREEMANKNLRHCDQAERRAGWRGGGGAGSKPQFSLRPRAAQRPEQRLTAPDDPARLPLPAITGPGTRPEPVSFAVLGGPRRRLGDCSARCGDRAVERADSPGKVSLGPCVDHGLRGLGLGIEGFQKFARGKT